MNKKKLFIFLIGDQALNYNNYRFRINYIKKKFNVNFIVFTNILHRKNRKYLKKNNYYYLNELEDFDKIPCDYSQENYILDFTPDTIQFVDFKKKLVKKKFYFIKYETGLIPSNNKKYNIFQNIKKIIKHQFKKKNIFDYNLYLVSGLKSNYLNNNLKLVYTSSLNYGEYVDYLLNVKNKKYIKEKKENYSVFLDEMVPDHPHMSILNYKNIWSIQEYYKSIETFLRKMEIILNHKIKILLHPRATKNYYSKNFEVVQNDTCKNIAGCKNVFAHQSTSIAYAVLFKKNIIYLTCKKLSWLCKIIENFHSHTGGQILDITKKIDKEIFLKNLNYEEKKYLSYISNFIRHPKSRYFFDYILMNIEKFK
jgi:hypothetical protein